MRIGILALLQESNTFLTGKTTLAHFEQDLLCEGEEVRRRMAGAHHEVGGFFAGLDDAGLEAVSIFAARALPYGVITADAFDELLRRMIAALDRAGPLDGLLVAPHGATVAENAPDADGHWLAAVRERVGAKVPIIGTLDLHANLSPQMVDACDALIAYRMNPHLDQRARGQDAAALLARTLRGDVRPTMAARFPPLAVNIERQSTSASPCRELYAQADEQLRRPGVLSNSLLLGFPYADVSEMGAAVVAVTDNDAALAGRLADELADYWWKHRRDFVGQLIGVNDAATRAAALDGPVCLLDMGDNVGGGSPGDGTLISHELHRRRLGPSFVCLADAEAMRAAQQAGIGNRVRLRVGGKTDTLHGEPLDADFTVRGLSDGHFTEPNPRHGGITAFDQGPTAVVESDGGLTVMLTTKRMVPFSLNQLTSCGLDPARFRVLVAKGVHAPVAAYAPVCKHLIRVDTPGVTSADLHRLTYRHRRRPLFPFEVNAE
jgi:microcystin degradation protein MlrC